MKMFKQSKARTDWQDFALHNMVDTKGQHIQKGHYRRIGKLLCLLTVDCDSKYAENRELLWHASVSVILGVDKRYNMPVSPSLDAISLETMGEVQRQCKTMLRGVGIGDGFWTGEPASLHLWKPLKSEEIEII